MSLAWLHRPIEHRNIACIVLLTALDNVDFRIKKRCKEIKSLSRDRIWFRNKHDCWFRKLQCIETISNMRSVHNPFNHYLKINVTSMHGLDRR